MKIISIKDEEAFQKEKMETILLSQLNHKNIIKINSTFFEKKSNSDFKIFIGLELAHLNL